ncbi:hypothetical protein OF83DRAFT_1102274 [Amylostereum chailletii]|nr:hypothetical protein OF83DRAFT_1102274 [Amylostereum chailletii]
MCTGAILLYRIPRVVVGSRAAYHDPASEALLRARGVAVLALDDPECAGLMRGFIAEHPEIWYEDIGEEAGAVGN